MKLPEELRLMPLSMSDAVIEAIVRDLVQHTLGKVPHIKDNAAKLAKFGGDNVDEARCRELCAMYLEEHARDILARYGLKGD